MSKFKTNWKQVAKLAIEANKEYAQRIDNMRKSLAIVDSSLSILSIDLLKSVEYWIDLQRKET